jgi:rubrerythrin
LAKREKPWFGFSGGGFGEPEALGTSVHQIPRSGGLVDIPSLPFRLGNDVRWIRDVHIEYRADQRYYDNEELSYQLPRKNLIARGFCALPARVDSDGGLSIEMRPKAPLILQIPEDRDLLLNAIGCGRRIGYTGDFKWVELHPVYQDHGLSDKAKYCRGVLNLFEGLQSAHRMFENRFWRRNFYRLAKLNSEATATENSPLYNKIAKHPDQWTVNPNVNRDDELRRIESLITKYARNIRTSETDVTFRFLADDFKKERDEAIAQNPHLTPGDEQEAAAQAESELKRTLQELVNAMILQQGIITHCRQCGSRIWRELGAIKQEFECPGCGATTHAPVEGRWHYRLNSLVSKAISEHGTVPLINALAKAREEARNSFIYSPGFQFYVRYEDKSPITEVDAICLVDGKLWIGEVKSNAREFSDRDMNKLISDAKALGADKAFVYAQEGNQNALNSQCKSFSAQSGIEIIHLYPSGFGTMPTYYA